MPGLNNAWLTPEQLAAPPPPPAPMPQAPTTGGNADVGANGLPGYATMPQAPGTPASAGPTPGELQAALAGGLSGGYGDPSARKAPVGLLDAAQGALGLAPAGPMPQAPRGGPKGGIAPNPNAGMPQAPGATAGKAMSQADTLQANALLALSKGGPGRTVRAHDENTTRAVQGTQINAESLAAREAAEGAQSEGRAREDQIAAQRSDIEAGDAAQAAQRTADLATRSADLHREADAKVDSLLDEQKAQLASDQAGSQYKGYWQDKGTGTKIATGLALALGALGGAHNGGHNVAAETLERARKDDFDQFQANLANRKGMRAESLALGDRVARQFATRDEQEHAHHILMLEAAKHQTDRRVAGNASELARAKAENLKADLTAMQTGRREELGRAAVTQNSRFVPTQTSGGGLSAMKQLELAERLKHGEREDRGLDIQQQNADTAAGKAGGGGGTVTYGGKSYGVPQGTTPEGRQKIQEALNSADGGQAAAKRLADRGLLSRIAEKAGFDTGISRDTQTAEEASGLLGGQGQTNDGLIQRNAARNAAFFNGGNLTALNQSLEDKKTALLRSLTPVKR